MCFSSKAPSPPPVPEEDPNLKAQREAQLADAQAKRSDEKKDRLENAIARTSGQYGFRSLISGSRGGGGFGRGLMD